MEICGQIWVYKPSESLLMAKTILFSFYVPSEIQFSWLQEGARYFLPNYDFWHPKLIIKGNWICYPGPLDWRKTPNPGGLSIVIQQPNHIQVNGQGGGCFDCPCKDKLSLAYQYNLYRTAMDNSYWEEGGSLLDWMVQSVTVHQGQFLLGGKVFPQSLRSGTINPLPTKGFLVWNWTSNPAGGWLGFGWVLRRQLPRIGEGLQFVILASMLLTSFQVWAQSPRTSCFEINIKSPGYFSKNPPGIPNKFKTTQYQL
jgi:hypothetical protein